LELEWRERTADVVALGDVAAEAAEQIPGLAVFDTLRDDLQAELMAQLDRRPDDREVARVVGHVADERLIDLNVRHRQSFYIAERRVAGAEVVDRDADPHLTQTAEDLGRVRRVGH